MFFKKPTMNEAHFKIAGIMIRDYSTQQYGNWQGDAVIAHTIGAWNQHSEILESLEEMEKMGFVHSKNVSNPNTSMDKKLWMLTNKFKEMHPEEFI